MRTLTRLLLVALLLPLCVAAYAEPAKTQIKTANYLVYYMGSRIGWMSSTIAEAKRGDETCLREDEKTYIKIQRSFDGQTFEIQATVENWYRLDGTPLASKDTTKNGAQTVVTEVSYAENEAVISVTVDRNPPVKVTLDSTGKKLHSMLSAWAHLRDNVKDGESFTFHKVSSDDHLIVQETWTRNGKIERILADKTTVEGMSVRSVDNGKAATLIIGNDDLPSFYEAASGFSLERCKEIPKPFVAEAVSMRTVMESNVDIASWRKLDRMELSFAYPHDDDEHIPQLADSNGYHDVHKSEKGYVLRLKSQRLADDEKPAYPLAEVAEDVKRYLKATPMCQSDDTTLAAEAQKLAKGKTDAREVAMAIIKFVSERLKGGSGETGAASALQAYKERQGDCTEHSALFVALARASGLPARQVGGVVYAAAEDGSGSIMGYHAWSEVWLGRWVPVDATVNELGTSARYILFEIDEPGETHGSGRSSRCMRADIRPVIDRYSLSDGRKWTRKGAPESPFKE